MKRYNDYNLNIMICSQEQRDCRHFHNAILRQSVFQTTAHII